jgi:hypothetical protein
MFAFFLPPNRPETDPPITDPEVDIPASESRPEYFLLAFFLNMLPDKMDEGAARVPGRSEGADHCALGPLRW